MKRPKRPMRAGVWFAVALAGSLALSPPAGAQISQHYIKLCDAGEYAVGLHAGVGSWVNRVQAMCAIVAQDYDGDAARIWSDGVDAAEVERRLCGLPGISTFKARSIIGILARRLGTPLPGWEDHVPSEPSMIDVISPETLRAYQLS